jgi:hypothetical protein
VHHFKCTPATDPTQTDLDDITEGVRSAAVHLLTDEMSSNLVFEGSRSKFWTTAGDLWTGEALNPVLGSQSSTPSTLAACYVISWRVHRIWRGGKPRSYLSGVNEAQVSDGRTVSGGAVTANTGNARDYLTATAGLTSGALSIESMVCLRRFADGGSEATPKVYLDPPELVTITDGVCRSVMGTQRRRLHRL